MKENNCPIEDTRAYLAGRALCAESAVFRRGRGGFSALEQHPPGIFVCRVEEPAQSSVLRRVELPQAESPLLTREDQADEHNLDYVDKFELLVHQGLDACLESGQLSFFTPRQAYLLPGGEPRGGGRIGTQGVQPIRRRVAR